MSRFEIAIGSAKSEPLNMLFSTMSLSRSIAQISAINRELQNMSSVSLVSDSLDICTDKLFKCKSNISELSNSLLEIVNAYELAEDNVIASIKHDSNRPPVVDIIGREASAGGGVIGSIAKGSVLEGLTVEQKAQLWLNNVSDAELAALCGWCNSSAETESEEAMREKFMEYLHTLPENDPLRWIPEDKIVSYRYKSGMEAIVIELDPDHAVVIFAGTDSPADAGADAALSLTGNAGFQDNDANDLISGLPYKDITVTGHSLGGYLAADVTLKNANVSNCVTFDAPGHDHKIVVSQSAKDNLEFNPADPFKLSVEVNKNAGKVHNYIAKGSPVSAVNEQVGTYIRELDIQGDNWAGIFYKHGIDGIKDSLGGDQLISAIYENPDMEGLEDITSGSAHLGSVGVVGGGGGQSW